MQSTLRCEASYNSRGLERGRERKIVSISNDTSSYSNTECAKVLEYTSSQYSLSYELLFRSPVSLECKTSLMPYISTHSHERLTSLSTCLSRMHALPISFERTSRYSLSKRLLPLKTTSLSHFLSSVVLRRKISLQQATIGLTLYRPSNLPEKPWMLLELTMRSLPSNSDNR